jgi:hypothetical protein
MDDIVDEGIEIGASELYEFIYDNGYNCSDEKLKMLLDDFDNSKNMFFPLDCHCDRETSYADWLEYKTMRDEEAIKREEIKELEAECREVVGTPFGHNIIRLICMQVKEKFGKDEADRFFNKYQV